MKNRINLKILINSRSSRNAKTPKKGPSNPVSPSNSKRNLSAQYFGEHLFSLTSGEEKLSTATQRNTKKCSNTGAI